MMLAVSAYTVVDELCMQAYSLLTVRPISLGGFHVINVLIYYTRPDRLLSGAECFVVMFTVEMFCDVDDAL